MTDSNASSQRVTLIFPASSNTLDGIKAAIDDAVASASKIERREVEVLIVDSKGATLDQRYIVSKTGGARAKVSASGKRTVTKRKQANKSLVVGDHGHGIEHAFVGKFFESASDPFGKVKLIPAHEGTWLHDMMNLIGEFCTWFTSNVHNAAHSFVALAYSENQIDIHAVKPPSRQGVPVASVVTDGTRSWEFEPTFQQAQDILQTSEGKAFVSGLTTRLFHMRGTIPAQPVALLPDASNDPNTRAIHAHPLKERREKVRELKLLGRSRKDIATGIGESQDTVKNDLNWLRDNGYIANG
jgi:hypothetical protein